jgi:hypothetical protein
MRYSAILLLPLAFTSCKDEESGGSVTNVTASTPIYDSGDLGQLLVMGAMTEARARFSFNGNEWPMAVHVTGAYVPAGGNTVGAIAELSLYDTKADGDSGNDVLIGQLSPSSPWSRGRLDALSPGSFSILCPLGAGTDESVGPQVETIGIRLRISTASWHGSITSFRVKVVTLKGVENRLVPLSFLRDQ